MTTPAIEQELLALKDAALAATQRADGAFYADYLDDAAIAIVPFGVFDKAAIVAQMSSPKSAFRSTAIEDTRALALTADTGLVTYKATYPTGQVMVTTVYVKKAGRWKGVFYQQTPLVAR
jgi:hypothetical protein